MLIHIVLYVLWMVYGLTKLTFFCSVLALSAGGNQYAEACRTGRAGKGKNWT